MQSQSPHPSLAVQYRAIESLKPDPKNARRHSARQIQQLVRSIKTFGFNMPILVDGEGRVIAGHGRLLACQKMECTEVPVIEISHLSEAQIRAYMIADNRLAEISTWDNAVLAQTLGDLADAALDFSLEITGFDMGEIDLLIEGLVTHSDAKSDLSERVQPLTGPAVSQSGDVWQLGRNRVLCGNALLDTSYHALMHSERAAMVFTDPPYNVPIQGNVGGLGQVQHREFAMASGEMTEAEFTDFLTRSFRQMAAYSADGALQFVFMDWRHMAEVLAAGRAAFSELKNLAVWVKSNAGMGSFYRSQHELVFVFKHGKAAHRNNIALGKHGRNRSNVWQYASPAAFGRTGDEGKMLALHPTVKPVALVSDAILDCTQRGDIVLDPYLGSGTTLIAAEKVGRKCYGIEFDPLYVDTIIKRYIAHAGEQAIHIGTGMTFDEVASTHEVGHV